jgi:hypothetical protein
MSQGVVYMEQKTVKERLPHMKTQYSKIVYPKEYTNTIQPVTAQHLTNSTANCHLPLTQRRVLENMTKDPITEFFINKKNPDICSGAAEYISSEEIFNFLTIKTQYPPTFCSSSIKRTRIYARGLQSTYPRRRFLVFLMIKIQDLPTFYSK